MVKKSWKSIQSGSNQWLLDVHRKLTVSFYQLALNSISSNQQLSTEALNSTSNIWYLYCICLYNAMDKGK